MQQRLNEKEEGVVETARLPLEEALGILNKYEDIVSQELFSEIEGVADHIRDVLDQLSRHCPKHLKLHGG